MVIVGGGIAAWLAFRGDDPVTTAKLKCETAIEAVTGYDLGVGEVADMHVTGDVFNGRVQSSFGRSGTTRRGECVFVNGTTARVAVDGRVLAGR